MERAIETWGQGSAGAAGEAEALMREVHHRISNHLQVLASLVGLQARGHPSPETREALLAVRRRILAIARLHAELQRGRGEGTVEVSHFFRRLGEDLRLCFAGEEGASGLRLDFRVEPGEAPVETAISLALIANELITNAMKHAVLPAGGGIEVSLRREPDGAWRLTVRDEGPGFPKDAFEAGDEHGFSLVHFLVRRHRGVLSVDPGAGGASVSVSLY